MQLRFLSSMLLIVGLAACQSGKVKRIDPNTDIDLSGRWNDVDSKRVADEMIYALFNSTNFQEYADALGRKPVIVVGLIKNKTSEHIDADNYVKKLEIVIHNSGLATLVESSEFRDELRKERAEQQDFAAAATAKQFGQELGADLMLFGEMNSETDVSKRERVVNYVTTLFLTDVETNRRVWYGQHEIKKLIKN